MGRAGIPTAASIHPFLARAFCRGDRSIDRTGRSRRTLERDPRERRRARTAVPSSALEAFFLSGALLINARRNQRTLYVIEEGEKRGEIERL